MRGVSTAAVVHLPRSDVELERPFAVGHGDAIHADLLLRDDLLAGLADIAVAREGQPGHRMTRHVPRQARAPISERATGRTSHRAMSRRPRSAPISQQAPGRRGRCLAFGAGEASAGISRSVTMMSAIATMPTVRLPSPPASPSTPSTLRRLWAIVPEVDARRFSVRIDWASQAHAVCVIDHSGRVHWQGAGPHTARRLAELRGRLRRCRRPRGGPTRCTRSQVLQARSIAHGTRKRGARGIAPSSPQPSG